MIDLYTWPTPNGRKVSIALEEFELPYRVHSVDLQQRQQFDPDFLRISPNNKIPAIVDQDTDTALMESGAILLYLAKKTDRFWGEDTWQTMQWLMWQMAGLGPMLGQVHFFNKHNLGQSPYAEERFTAEAARLYGVLDARLAGRSYVSGDYSIADMAIWPWISRFEWQDIDLKDYPNICRWYQEIAQRPAVQKGYDVPHYVNPIPMPN
ncbi:MAG: glutathione S-transferase [Gammaproteobacteria bacterium TMED134]|nr:MAG: glutathione S-transferase [Gammaproteobacteria bacterium TMED134]|tara:strand:- start:9094 stop:9717 length:624 start_codon:yes stop_codon:yes gene_type:complete